MASTIVAQIEFLLIQNNDLKIRLYTSDYVAMIKSTINRPIKLFARAVVQLCDMIAHQPFQVSKVYQLEQAQKCLSVGKILMLGLDFSLRSSS